MFNLAHSACSTSDEYSASCTVFHSSLLCLNRLYSLDTATISPNQHLRAADSGARSRQTGQSPRANTQLREHEGM